MMIWHRGSRSVIAAVLALFLLLSLFPLSAFGAEEEEPSTPFQGYLVKTAQPSQTSVRLRKTMALEADFRPDSLEGVEDLGDGLYVADTLEAAREIAARMGVEYIQPNYLFSLPQNEMLALVGHGESYEGSLNLTHLQTMKAARQVGSTYVMSDLYNGEDKDLARDMGGDGNAKDDIVVAVIDSGLRTDHPDLDYTRVLTGKNFLVSGASADDTDTTDEAGHGTFVTGIILATVDNEQGLDGLAAQVKVMPMKVFGQAGVDTSTDVIIRAIKHATNLKKAFDGDTEAESEAGGKANICVLNMSLGSPEADNAMKEAIEDAVQAGIIVVCAAGNDGSTDQTYPAQYAIGVGATGHDGKLNSSIYGLRTAASFTQKLATGNGAGWRNKVWVSAPGTGYTSTWIPETPPCADYSTGSGTSFATPMVSALAAVAVSLNNDLPSYYTTYQGENKTVDTVIEAISGTEDTNVVINSNHLAFKRLLLDTVDQSFLSGDTKVSNQGKQLGWGVVDFQKLTSALRTVSVSFPTRNAEGTELAGSVLLYPYDSAGNWNSSATIQPESAAQFGRTVYSTTRGGQYHYIVTAPGYNGLDGDFTMDRFARYYEIPVTLDPTGTKYAVTFTGLPEGVSLSVTPSAGGAAMTVTDNACELVNGEYTYTATAGGYIDATGSFTVFSRTLEIPVAMYKAHTHTYSTTVTPPTCTEDGYTTDTCTDCGYTETRDPVAALSHDYQETVTSPTCAAKGYTTHTCSRCGDSYKDTPVDMLSHTPGEPTEVGPKTEPTCTEAGSHTLVTYCTVCHTEVDRKTETLPALGHDYTSVVTPPTCTAKGFTTNTCSRCGKITVDHETDALDHDYQFSATVAPTCVDPGYDLYICSRCREEVYKTENVVAPLGHDYGTPTYVWSSNKSTVTATRICARDAAHKETETVNTTNAVTKAATATADGVRTYTAVFVNPAFTTQTATVSIPATGGASSAGGTSAGGGTSTGGGASVGGGGVSGGTTTASYSASFTFTGLSTGKTVTVTVVNRSTKKTAATFTGKSCTLPSGSYTYTASADGYEDATGDFTIGSKNVSLTVAMSPTAYTVTFTGLPEKITTTITISRTTNRTTSVVTTTTNGRCQLPDGNYTYTTHAEGYRDSVNPFTVSGKDRTVTVSMTKTASTPTPVTTPVPVSTPTPVATPVPVSTPEPVATPTPTAASAPATAAPAQAEPVAAPPAEEPVRLSRVALDTYDDIRADAWYVVSVGYVTDKGLFAGTGEREFNPEISMTHAMMMAVLYRLAGSPGAADDTGALWYRGPADWVTEHGLNADFAQVDILNTAVTREQLVTMLFRYSAQKGYLVTPRADLSGFMDVEYISPYAREAMAWAHAVGLIQGMDWGGLDPLGTATRSQMAAIFMRFCENVTSAAP